MVGLCCYTRCCVQAILASCLALQTQAPCTSFIADICPAHLQGPGGQPWAEPTSLPLNDCCLAFCHSDEKVINESSFIVRQWLAQRLD